MSCLCVCPRASLRTTHPIFTNFFCPCYPYLWIGPFWRRCSMSCTSGLWTTSCFRIMGRMTWGAECSDEPICICICLSVREHISETARPIFTKLFAPVPVAVARSSHGGVVARVLLVLWMTSYLQITGNMGRHIDRYRCSE